jgi:hypothetical protein
MKHIESVKKSIKLFILCFFYEEKRKKNIYFYKKKYQLLLFIKQKPKHMDSIENVVKSD